MQKTTLNSKFVVPITCLSGPKPTVYLLLYLVFQAVIKLQFRSGHKLGSRYQGEKQGAQKKAATDDVPRKDVHGDLA